MKRFLWLIALAAGFMPTPAPGQELVVSGLVQWRDPVSNNPHPARFVRVSLRDERAKVILAQDSTDGEGRYRLAIRAPQQPLDLAVRAESWSRTAMVRLEGQEQPWFVLAQQAGVAGAREISVDLVADATTRFAQALSIITAIQYGHDYVVRRTGEWPARINVFFPAPQSAYAGSLGSGLPCISKGAAPASVGGAAPPIPLNRLCTLRIGAHDHQDWDVILHEYGHFASGIFQLNQQQSGTAHGFGVSLGKAYNSKGFALGLAWAEGWPTYFAIAAQANEQVRKEGVYGAGDSTYHDTGANQTTPIEFPLFSQASYPSLGEDDEGAVARILYDLADGVDPTGIDSIALGDKALWRILRTSSPKKLWDARNGAVAGMAFADSLRVDRIFAQHGVGPKLTTPAAVAMLQKAAPTFTWTQPELGWPLLTFRVEFRDLHGKRIGTSPPLTEFSFRPGDSLWNKVLQAKAPVYGILYASNSVKGLSTGPYMVDVRRFAP